VPRRFSRQFFFLRLAAAPPGIIFVASSQNAGGIFSLGRNFAVVKQPSVPLAGKIVFVESRLRLNPVPDFFRAGWWREAAGRLCFCCAGS
jgi:hypothetical protein